jgi:hypothetical protein
MFYLFIIILFIGQAKKSGRTSEMTARRPIKRAAPLATSDAT